MCCKRLLFFWMISLMGHDFVENCIHCFVFNRRIWNERRRLWRELRKIEKCGKQRPISNGKTSSTIVLDEMNDRKSIRTENWFSALMSQELQSRHRPTTHFQHRRIVNVKGVKTEFSVVRLPYKKRYQRCF